MSNTNYQLLITLQEVKPKVWRRIQVKADLKLFDFHKVLQVVMGWTNSHLHQFIKDGTFYLTRADGDEDLWEELTCVDYKGLKINDLLKKEKDSIIYEYDFGDGWKHTIVLEKVLPEETVLKKPICIDGARCCPHEDCGGAWGYNDLQKIIKKPSHPEYDEWMTWLGDDFDPEYFDATEVTSRP